MRKRPNSAVRSIRRYGDTSGPTPASLVKPMTDYRQRQERSRDVGYHMTWHFGTLKEEIEGVVLAAFDYYAGNAREAARHLDISPTTLYRHLEDASKRLSEQLNQPVDLVKEIRADLEGVYEERRREIIQKAADSSAEKRRAKLPPPPEPTFEETVQAQSDEDVGMLLMRFCYQHVDLIRSDEKWARAWVLYNKHRALPKEEDAILTAMGLWGKRNVWAVKEALDFERQQEQDAED